MSFKYKSVVPWGRSFNEYMDMFNLNENDINKKILGCGDGPASFNYEMTIRGKSVVSVDPIYKMKKEDIQTRINETYDDVINQTRRNKDKFVWNKIRDVDQLGQIRMNAMHLFLDDYEKGLKESRYIYAELPNLPFKDNQFELSLSSHFLFLYSDNLSFEFHLDAINEMLRVSNEVRIFPILDVNAKKSPYIPDVRAQLDKSGFFSEIIRVPYEFQKNGNKMLKIYKK